MSGHVRRDRVLPVAGLRRWLRVRGVRCILRVRSRVVRVVRRAVRRDALDLRLEHGRDFRRVRDLVRVRVDRAVRRERCRDRVAKSRG